MKTSDYNIYVWLPDENAYLVVQGYTGAVDLISEDIYQFLKSGPNGGNISEDTVETLLKRGYLTNFTHEEERDHLSKVAQVFHKRHLKGAGFLFAPTFSCQLRCVYCYEKPVAHRNDDFSKTRMTMEHVEKSYEAMDWIINNLDKHTPEDITLYGGEPLIESNFDVVRAIVEKGQEKGFRFRAITNGYDLVRYKDLLGTDKIGYLQVTLDGPESVHNKRRFARERKPTFENICDGIQLALDQGCKVVMRSNVDKDNLDSLNELNQVYFDRGWARHKNFFPYANITHDWMKSKMLEPMDLLRATDGQFEEFEEIEGIGKGRRIKIDFGVTQCFGVLLRPGQLPMLRPYFCGANVGSYIFGPDGNIYTCWDEVGREEGKIGSYLPKLEWKEDLINEWQSRHISNIPECLDCAYALLCGGGCAIQAKKSNGTMFSPYCFQFQDTFQHLAPHVYKSYKKAMAERETNDKAIEKNNELCA